MGIIPTPLMSPPLRACNAGSINFLLIDFLTLCASGYYFPRQIMVSVLIAVSKCGKPEFTLYLVSPWSPYFGLTPDPSPRAVTPARTYLASYLFYRVLKRGHDARFDEMRSNFWAFLGFWVFQMLWAW